MDEDTSGGMTEGAASPEADPVRFTASDKPHIEGVPVDLAAERALLGTLLLVNDYIDQISDLLLPEHFFDGFHGAVFEAIVDQFQRRRGADPVTILPRVSKHPGFQAAGGIDFFTRLIDDVPTTRHYADYARAVYDCALKRGLIRIGHGIAHKAGSREEETDAEGQIADAEKNLFELATGGKLDKHIRTFKSALKDTLTMAESAFRRDGALAGISTGISSLDERLGGLQASDLIILAGRPAMGKTALATTIAFNIADARRHALSRGQAISEAAGAPVLFFSLEMSAEQLATRVISQRVEISSSAVRRGAITGEEFGRLVETADLLAATPLFIDDTGGISIAALAARARRLVRQEGIGAIFVDYLQLVTPSGSKRSENRVQEISEVTRTLKALAKELNVPVIALSQLSRAVESREDKRPQLSDLRESGSIEQDADIVMFVYREEYYLAQREPADGKERDQWMQQMEKYGGKAEVIIGKHRHSSVGKVELAFNAQYTQFSNLARPSDLSHLD